MKKREEQKLHQAVTTQLSRERDTEQKGKVLRSLKTTKLATLCATILTTLIESKRKRISP